MVIHASSFPTHFESRALSRNREVWPVKKKETRNVSPGFATAITNLSMSSSISWQWNRVAHLLDGNNLSQLHVDAGQPMISGSISPLGLVQYSPVQSIYILFVYFIN